VRRGILCIISHTEDGEETKKSDRGRAEIKGTQTFRIVDQLA